jgi:defect-in-organelle-trafficking protein DotA
MKKIINLLIIIFLTSISSFAFADDYSNQLATSGLFTIAPADQSVNMLMRLFGSIGTVLPGSPGLLGAMFQKFNYAILLIMVLTVMAYTLFRAILESAHHGEFMGKKLDKLWVPIRIVMGICLIVPTVGGYSIIQAIVMWVVLQGVGAADNIWKTVLVYFQNHGGQVITPPTLPENNIYANQMGQNLLAGLVCMYKAAKADGVTYDAPTLSVKFDHNPASQPHNDAVFSYTTKGGVVYNCADVQWVNPASLVGNTKALIVQNAVEQLVGTLNLTAKNMVYLSSSGSTDASGYNPVAIAAGYLNSAVYAGSDDQNKPQTLNDAVWKAAYNNGWALAGTYYYLIAQQAKQASVNSSLGDADVVRDVCDPSGNPYSAKTGEQYKFLIDACQTTKPLFSSIWQPDHSGQTQDERSGDDYWQCNSNASTATGGNTDVSLCTEHARMLNGSDIKQDVDPLSLIILNYGTDKVNDAFNRDLYDNLSTSTDANGVVHGGMNPVVAVATFGQDTVDQLETAFVIFSYALMGLGAVMGICEAEIPTTLILITQMFVSMPMLIALFGGLYLVGLTLGVYVPLIPYIIFFFAVMGWLLAVLESIIAAPLVALGITYPEGSEMWGKADPALMLLTNIFLRPSLMIFGLMAGMLISYIGVSFINTTFVPVVHGTHGIFTGSIHPLEFLMLLIVYGGIIVAFLNQTFSLIHIIPDQVLRWIGGQHQFGHYGKADEALQTAQGGAGQLKQGASERGGAAPGMAKGAHAASAGVSSTLGGGGDKPPAPSLETDATTN